VLALAAYKPNVLALFALGMVIRHPRLLLGMIPVAFTLLILLYGSGALPLLGEYLGVLDRLAGAPWDVETPFWKVHGLAPYFDMLTPAYARPVTCTLGLLAACGIGWWWRRRDAFDPRAFWPAIAGLLIVNSLLNPYTPIYDLMLLAPATLCGIAALRALRRHTEPSVPGISAAPWQQPAAVGVGTGEIVTVEPAAVHPLLVQLFVAALFFGPHLSQALAKGLDVQIFPLALLAIGLWFWREVAWSKGAT
jgi:hypothetical protein